MEITKKEDGTESAYLTSDEGKNVLKQTLFDFLMAIKEGFGGEPGADAVADCEIGIGDAKFLLSVTYLSDKPVKPVLARTAKKRRAK